MAVGLTIIWRPESRASTYFSTAGTTVSSCGSNYKQGPLYLLLLVGGLELDVGVPEHIAVNHDEDRFLDELAQLASKLCEVFFPLKRQPKEVKLIVLLYQILDETYSIWQ